MQFKIKPISETNLIMYFGNEIDTHLAVNIGNISDNIRQNMTPKLIEVIPSYTSIMIEFNPLATSFDELTAKLTLFIKTHSTPSNTNAKTIILPTYYDPDVGPDLKTIADITNLSINEIIKIHSQTIYTVCAIGFAPGFAFLAKVDNKIAIKRHSKPRPLIPLGSVGIANQQTAVYPSDSAAGWQIIGNCPIPLYTPNATSISPFRVGNKVKFEPIDKSIYLRMGGAICKNWK